MARHSAPSHPSYSSATMSSTSSADSASSSGTYASIGSLSSYASRLSLQIRSAHFWAQFDRSQRKRHSVSAVFKQMFSKKPRGEPEKPSPSQLRPPPAPAATYLFPGPVSASTPATLETSFTSARLAPLRGQVSPRPATAPACPAPAGLYCVIEDFLTEYDLRLLEEEQRAELLATSSRAVS